MLSIKKVRDSDRQTGTKRDKESEIQNYYYILKKTIIVQQKKKRKGYQVINFTTCQPMLSFLVLNFVRDTQ